MTNLLLSSVSCGYNPLPPPKTSTSVTDGFPLPLTKTCSLYIAQLCTEFGDDSIFQICAALTSEKAKWSHYGPLPPNCWKFSKSTILEWTQHSSNCEIVPYTILASQTPTEATFKTAMFTILPRSSALVIHLSTRNATCHNNHTRHTTLHLYFIPCQFYLYCSHSQFVCTSRSVSSFQLHPKIKQPTICSHDSYGAKHAASRTQCLTKTVVHRFFPCKFSIMKVTQKTWQHITCTWTRSEVNPGLPVTYAEKQPHHLTELYSHMQYRSILGRQSTYKSVPTNS